MSINVTVKGNPVSIKHGKMMTVDPNYEKKEFDKRRLMRLEQVRQQSKEIAEDIRNKVRKEKKKQMCEIEKEGKEKIRNWQNRKLLELQNQYKEALEELGMGHKEAEACVDKESVLSQQKEIHKHITDSRSKTAATKLQVQKNQESFKKAVPLQRKKIVRDVENTRALLVTNLKKKKTGGHMKKNTKRPKTSADISITIPYSEEELHSSSQNSEILDGILSNIPEEKTESTSTSPCKDEVQLDNTVLNAKYTGARKSYQQELSSDLHKKKSDRSPSPKRLNSEFLPSNSYSETVKKQEELIEYFRKNKPQVTYDTRISDRIKQRKVLADQPDYCDFEPELYPTQKLDFKLRGSVGSGYTHNFMSTGDSSDSEKCICCKMSCCNKFKREIRKNSFDNQRLQETDFSRTPNNERPITSEVPVANPQTSQSKTNVEISSQPPVKLKSDNFTDSVRQKTDQFSKATTTIPSKPPIALKTYGSERPKNTSVIECDKVPYYDHRNRFHTKKDVPFSNVEKITSDSLEVLPNTVSEAEWREKIRQRDREAQIRGRRALEKERVQRDYQEIVQKLPLLQKKERIQEMYKDKPEYHMSDERRRELERKRQNTLENAYTKAVPSLQPAIVTLPSKKHKVPPPSERLKDIEVTDSHTLNLSKWGVDQETPKLFSADEVQEIIKVFTGQKPQDRQAKLKELLKSLKLQKEQLINEIKALPKDDSIQALLTDLNSFTDSDENKEQKKKVENSERKRRRDENEIISLSEGSSTSSEIKGNEKGEGEGRRRHRKKHLKPPKKKARKSRQRVMVLQNTSTQTTPKAAKSISDDENSSLKETSATRLMQVKVCEKTHTPCGCSEQKKKDILPEELCQIYIKIDEDDTPQVIVRSGKDETEKPAITKPKQISVNSPKKVKTRTVAVGTESVKENQLPSSMSKRNSEIKSHETKPEQKPPNLKSKVTSWRDQLSKNSVSTSSTSYYSPPDFSKTSASKSKYSVFDLRNKPHQDNIDNLSTSSSNRSSQGDKTIDPRLLNYIRKLLSMSRKSIDDLAVSSSDVQTPSQSVIEIESNNPMTHLHNIIKLFNLQAEDISQQLSSFSASSSNVPYNSPAGSAKSSVSQSRRDKSKIMIPEKDVGSSSEQIKQSVLSQYEKITDCCDKRIANIAAMIDKLREEKVKLTEKLKQTNDHDRDHSSTKYLELPSKSDKSTSSSLDEDSINKKILEIDMNLAKQLRIFDSPRDKIDDDAVMGNKHVAASKVKKRVQIMDGEYQPDKEDQDFLKRLERLLQNSPPTMSPQSPATHASTTAKNNNVFVPFLSNIPKLPKLESGPEISSSFKDVNSHRHPPPSKGLRIAKKFNDDISLIPHELSTIVEADSQLSTKISSAQISPSTTKLSISPSKFVLKSKSRAIREEYSDMLSKDNSYSKNKNARSPTSEDPLQTQKDLDAPKVITNVSCVSLQEYGSITRPLSSSSSSKKSTNSSSASTEALDSVEAMLRSIGMEWAIPTLRKTQEALALTSSTSSISLNAKSKSGNTSSGSEVSLKDFLQKQILTKISSSTLKSDASPCSALELSELSAIQVNSSSGGEKSQQKTSTPVLAGHKSSSKSKDSNKPVFTVESEISSVKFTSLSDSNNSSSKSSK